MSGSLLASTDTFHSAMPPKVGFPRNLQRLCQSVGVLPLGDLTELPRPATAPTPHFIYTSGRRLLRDVAPAPPTRHFYTHLLWTASYE